MKTRQLSTTSLILLKKVESSHQQDQPGRKDNIDQTSMRFYDVNEWMH